MLRNDVTHLNHVYIVQQLKKIDHPNSLNVFLAWHDCICVIVDQAANEVALSELRSVQERLNVSERCVETLRGELRDMVAQRDTTHAELHQARLQAAQLTLQLADASLALREGRANWAKERETLQQNAEVRAAKILFKNTKATLRLLFIEVTAWTDRWTKCVWNA